MAKDKFNILLRRFRKKLNLNESALAKALKVSVHRVSDLERGRKKPADFSQCLEISAFYQLTPSEKDALLLSALFDRTYWGDKEFLDYFQITECRDLRKYQNVIELPVYSYINKSITAPNLDQKPVSTTFFLKKELEKHLNCYAVMYDEPSAVDLGHTKGDILVIDPDAKINTSDLVLVKINDSVRIRRYKCLEADFARMCQFLPYLPDEPERIYNEATESHKYEIFGKIVFGRKQYL